MAATDADKAVEQALGALQDEVAALTEERDEALAILQELRKHTRLTDKNDMRFTSEYPEGLYDRFDRFMRKRTEEADRG